MKIEEFEGKKIKQIAAGANHTVAIDADGDIWTWGRNVDSQLGYETAPDNFAKQPKAISKPPEVEQFTQIAAGGSHTVALDENGNVWTWGYNGYGQLGDGTNTKRNTPVAVNKPDGVEKFTQIATGWHHTVAIDEDGDIWTWGNNEYGQLGNGTSGSYKKTPVAVNKEQGLKTAVQVAAGAEHTVALDSQGSIWGWGNNYHGYLGDGSKSNSRNVPVQSLVYTTPIQLTADTSDNDVDHDLEITFPKNKTFQRYINGIKVDGHSLEEGDYTVEDGKIILHQSETTPYLRKAGNITVTVSAEYYPDSEVIQPINHGAAHHLEIAQDIKEPTANKQPFLVQPVVHVADKYGNLCTSDNTTEVTVSKGDSGNWELEGTRTVTVKGGAAIFTDLRPVNDYEVKDIQLSFSADKLGEVLSHPVTLPEKLPPGVPEIYFMEEGDRHVKLAWRKVEDAVSYNIYMSTIPRTYTTPAAVTVNTDYEITGLENGTTYYFTVTAVDYLDKESGHSNEVRAVPNKVTTPPDPPQNVYATASDRKAVIKFDAPSDDGGSPIIKYIVTSYPDHVVAEGTMTSIIVDKLRNGITYTFTVKAVNAKGESNESAPSNPVIPRASSGGGSTDTTGGGGGSTSWHKRENEKDLSENNKKDQEQILDVVTEIKGKQVKGIAQVILKTQNNNSIAELIINEEKLTELLKEEPGQAVIRFIFDNPADDKSLDQIICNLSEEITQYSTYIELILSLSEDIDDEKVITGVRTQEDGSLSHIPTKIITRDGKKYARLKIRSGGKFTVINSDKSFKDMKGHWAEDIVKELASRLILDTYGSENFNPGKKTTRAEFAEIITRALGLMQKGAGKDLFTDISKEDTYYDAVTIAYEYGIISGYGDGSFRPDKEITREEAMAMMVRAMKVAGIEVSLSEEEIDTLLSGYKDTSSISPWVREYVAICIKLGIVNGRPDKAIAPKDSISMAEMAVMIHRLLRASDLI